MAIGSRTEQYQPIVSRVETRAVSCIGTALSIGPNIDRILGAITDATKRWTTRTPAATTTLLASCGHIYNYVQHTATTHCRPLAEIAWTTTNCVDNAASLREYKMWDICYL